MPDALTPAAPADRPADISPAPERLLTKREVLRRVPVSSVKLWTLITSGKFPQPVVLDPDDARPNRRIYFRESEVDAWIAGLKPGMGSQPIGARYRRNTSNKPEPAPIVTEPTVPNGTVVPKPAASTAPLPSPIVENVPAAPQARPRPRLLPRPKRAAVVLKARAQGQ
jgi:predicted DNA-binding transcriptional regulator AlpA